MTAQLELAAVDAHLSGRYAGEIAAAAPVLRRLAERAGGDGATIADLRLALGLPKGNGRALSWLSQVPKAAGLVSSGKRRMSPIPGTRNAGIAWILPEYGRAEAL